MHAIISTGEKKYRVAPGDVIRVETLDGDVGTELDFTPVAVFKGEGELLAGSGLGDAKVKATITGNGRSKKVLVFKFKRESSTSGPSGTARITPRSGGRHRVGSAMDTKKV